MKEIPTKPDVGSLLENKRKRDLSSVYNDQDNHFDSINQVS